MMTAKQTTSYTEQTLVNSGQYSAVSAAVSEVLVRDKEQRAREAQLLKARLDRRMALPANEWDEWKPGAVLTEFRADRSARNG